VNATRSALADPIATTATDSLVVPGDTVQAIKVYQRTARRIVRDPTLSYIQAALAVLRLIQEARKAEAPELAVEAILSEAWGYVSGGERPLDREAIAAELAASDRVDQAIRAQLRKQHARCETCLRLLPDERALDRQRDQRRVALEGAV
jgi:hypothetical protein